MNPHCTVIDRNYRAFAPRVDPANRKRNLPDVSIAAVTDVSANEALGTVECIDGKPVAKAACDTNEVQPVNLMHVSLVKET